MPNLFRPSRPHALPASASVATLTVKRPKRDADGRTVNQWPHVRLSVGGRTVHYPLTADGTKYLRPSRKWYGQYLDASGVVRRVPLSANKEAAASMLAEIVRRVELEKAGVIDRFHDHRRRPLSAHLDDWEASLKANGRGDEYVALKLARVRSALDGCRFVVPADLSAERLERYLADLRTAKGRSVQTVNDWLQAVKQFVRWLIENDRLDRNPFVALKAGNADADPRHNRRALTADEAAKLLAAARRGPTVRGLTGEDRYHLYLTALLTGFRAKELASLTPAAFALDADPPTAYLRASATKNGKPAEQPLPPELVAALRVFLAGKPADAPLWPSRWHDRPADLLKRDLDAAGIAYATDGRDGPEYLDFHSLRVSFITSLARAGVSPTVAKELARHADVNLTLGTYTRLTLHERHAAIDALPTLGAMPPSRESAALRMTGTDGRGCPKDVLPDVLNCDSGCESVIRSDNDSGPRSEDRDPPQVPKLIAFDEGSTLLEAERAGFEPADRFDPIAALAKRCFRPLSHLSGSRHLTPPPLRRQRPPEATGRANGTGSFHAFRVAGGVANRWVPKTQ